MTSLAMRKVFVIRRCETLQFHTVRCGLYGEHPAVIAFTRRQEALKYISLHHSNSPIPSSPSVSRAAPKSITFILLLLHVFTKLEGKKHKRKNDGELVVHELYLHNLSHRCSLNSLYIVMYHVSKSLPDQATAQDGDLLDVTHETKVIPPFSEPNDDIVFHLENCIKYY